jgi:hypothetical protein
MTQVIQGVIHGRTIELDGDPGIEDGRKIQVVLQVASLPCERNPAKRETVAGMMANYTDDDDAVLAEIYEDRICASRKAIDRDAR